MRNMPIKQKKIITNYSLLLFLGIFLYIAGIIISAIFGSYIEYNPIGDIALTNPIFALIFICFLAPIYEELVFRFWGIKKQKNRIIVGVISIIVIYSLIGIFTAIFAIILYALIIYFFRNEILLRNYSFAIVTSILFALAHFENFTFTDYLIALPSYLGISLILAFIVMRYNIFISMIFHAIYNTILLTLGGFFFGVGDTITFQTESFSAELKPVSAFTQKTHFYSLGDSIVYFQRDNLARIGERLIENSWEYNISVFPVSYSTYSLKTELRNNANNVSPSELLKALTKHSSLRVDTIKEDKTVYFLSVDDSNDLNSYKDVDIEAGYIIMQYCQELSKKWNKIIMLEPGFNPRKAVATKRIELLNNDKDIEEEMRNLEKEYKFRFRKIDTVINSINIYEQKFE